MLIAKIICFFVGGIAGIFSHNIDENFGEFVIDITTSLYASSSFTAFLCMKPENAALFSIQMSKSYVLHEITQLSEDHQFLHVHSMLAHRNFYVLDLDCEYSDEMLIKANEERLFKAPTKWLILQDIRFINDSSDKNIELFEANETLQSIFGNLNIFPDSEVILGQRTQENMITILSLYRPNSIHELIIENRGIWDNKNRIKLNNLAVSSRRRTNLQGMLLRGSVVITNPDTINHLENFGNKRIDVITKFSFALSKLLVARMNATVNFTFTPSWGYQEKNGTWNGMIGEIQRGDADFGATATFIVPSRLGVVHYIQLYTPDSVKFIFRRPPLSYVSNLFTLPFARSVWIASTIFCVCGLLILFLSMKWEWIKIKDIPDNKKLTGDLEANPTIGDNFLILFGAVTQQGSSFEPRTVPARMTIFMLLVLCLSLYAAYTANIVALLQSSSDAIKNVQDLMNSPFKIGLLDVVYNRHYFGSFEDSMRKEFYERRVKNQKNIWMKLEEGVSKVRNELFAFQTDLTAAYALIQSTFGEDEKCGFEEIDYFYVSYPLFTIKRQSPYQEIFRVGALWLGETGLKERYTHILYNKKPICTGQKKFISVGTVECYAAYLTIGCGMAVTFGIFLLEIIWSKTFGVLKVDVTDTEISRTLSSKSISCMEENVEKQFEHILD